MNVVEVSKIQSKIKYDPLALDIFANIMQFSHFKITKTELISKIQGEQSSVFESYLNKIQVQLEQNLPIKMVLPAFPAKSPNRNKAHDSIPDMADFFIADNLALLHGRCAFEEHTVRHLRRIQMR